MRKRLITALSTLLIFPGVIAVGDDSPADILKTPLAQRMEQFISDGALPMLYMRVEDAQGQPVFEHSAVNEELLKGQRLDGDTWFRIWSMSKLVTISLIMDLVEDDILTLADPVTRYIPEFTSLQVAVGPQDQDMIGLENPLEGCPLELEPLRAAITLLDLLNHEAGFYYATTGIPCIDEPLVKANLPGARDTDELLSRMATLPLIQQPGTTDYYGTNTTVLGAVAERATGQSLRELVRERITGPLQISGLQYGLPPGVELLPVTSGADGVLRSALPGELDIFGSQVPDYDPAHALFLGGEGMLATSRGYADFLRMMLGRGELNGHRYLTAKSVEEIAAPKTMLDSEWGYNGYNLWVNNGRLADGSQGVGGLWIGGGYEGTYFWIDPERELVGLIMTQIYSAPSAASNVHEILRELFYRQTNHSP